MTAYYRSLNPDGLRELKLGAWVTIGGGRRRVVAITINPATEADPELGVEVGDLVTTLELGAPGVPMTPAEERELRALAQSWPHVSMGGPRDTAFYETVRRLLATLDATRKLADEGLAGKTLDAEHEPWCYRRHAGDCVDGQAAAPAIAPSSTLREKARLVAQWHGAIGSGPLEVLDAELADLAAAVRAEPAAIDVERLARAILVAAQESDRRPITDGFEWYGSALEMAEGIRDALATEDAG